MSASPLEIRMTRLETAFEEFPVRFAEMNQRLGSIEVRLENVRSSLDAKIESARAEFDTKIESTRTELDTKINRLDGKIESIRGELGSKIDGNAREMRTFFIGLFVLIIGEFFARYLPVAHSLH